jgi:predicted small secreted protein
VAGCIHSQAVHTKVAVHFSFNLICSSTSAEKIPIVCRICNKNSLIKDCQLWHSSILEDPTGRGSTLPKSSSDLIQINDDLSKAIIMNRFYRWFYIVFLREIKMRKLFLFAVTLAALLGTAPLLTACHTTAGFGQDVSQGGHALTNSANANAPAKPSP